LIIWSSGLKNKGKRKDPGRFFSYLHPYNGTLSDRGATASAVQIRKRFMEIDTMGLANVVIDICVVFPAELW
jgi:hypothetical protein